MSTEPFAEFAPPVSEPTRLRRAITAAYRRSEPECMTALIAMAALPDNVRAAASATARRLVEALRAKQHGRGVEALVQEYALSSQEGVALMCLAEALLRIPDNATRDALIRDKIADGDWKSHWGDGRSLFVNAATWGLIVTGKLVESADDRGLTAALTRLVARVGEPVIRRAVDLAMRMMGEQFVTGETITEALERSREMEAKGFGYSYDMLGEAALTDADAQRYYRGYETAILAIGKASAGRGIYDGPGISIKLSALHPRYSRAQAERVMTELLPRVKALAALSKSFGIGFNIDAEEADRLELSLDLLEHLALDPDLENWDGLGFVVQAYGKRCPYVIDWIVDLARRANRRLMVRLVKGAYWDSEIKRAQVDGLADFPVYTRKIHTDIAYIACAKKLLAATQFVFPQFATHNAQTLATIYAMAGQAFTRGAYEFQCLHGMGEPLYEEVVGPDGLNRPCRIYAPVGTHETLLAYLVRRLLENGANSSFVNRISNPDIAIGELIADPLEQFWAMPDPGSKHDQIALPSQLYGKRLNSAGLDLTDENVLAELSDALRASAEVKWSAEPMVADLQVERAKQPVINPANHEDVVGTVAFALADDAAHAAARAAGSSWPMTAAPARADCLERAADILQARMPHLLGLIVREAGKSLPNAIAEVREAVDFLRYYADQARTEFGSDHRPLGPVVCISPWNFPLAIFTGQIAAALAAGNPVLAKPAEETPLIAAEAVRILHESGIPQDALSFLPGEGSIGAALVSAPEIQAVMFTGSTEVARSIQKTLAGRLLPDGRPIPFIAETGGQNAMVVDSSALAEQVVADVIASAFDSAGQRCSALRILCLQEEIADRTLVMLKGALRELRIGNTDRLAVDVGPVISKEAKATINGHVDAMRRSGCVVEAFPLSSDTSNGTFVAPTIIEIDAIARVEREVFGPVLHVVRYRRDELDTLIDSINATGYGLTFGLHTRLDDTIAKVSRQVEVGNIYINRNVIGAVVGVQPFGGRGLSGTGPKAGGPLYLRRLVRQLPEPPPHRIAPADPALFDLMQWLQDNDETAAWHIASRLGSAAPTGSERELAGPVGERNLYTLRRRGTILLRPTTRLGLLHQMSAALATGNDFAVEADAALVAILAELPASVRKRLRPSDRLAGALIEGQPADTAKLLVELAERPGAIVVAQAACPEQMADPNAYRAEWLLEEVSVSVNTTAAGGNASLMTL